MTATRNPRDPVFAVAETPDAGGGARFSIRVASRLTSIELDTLRMWERRYGFPRPQRTPGGTRLYTQADIDALKLVRRALDRGYRPGEVVGRSRDELRQLIVATGEQVPRSAAGARATGEEPLPEAPSVASMLDTLLADDAAALRIRLRQAALALGPRGFVTGLAHPLSVRVGALWAEGKLEVRHEHLLSECLSAQLHLLMEAFTSPASAPRVLLATLSGERHGLGLEMIEICLADSGVTPIRLGVDTPADQIVRAARAHDVDAVGLLVTYASDLTESAKSIRWMSDELPRRVPVWIGGAAGAELKVTRDSVRIVSTWDDLDAAIGALTRRER